MSALQPDKKVKLPHRGARVTVSSRRLPASAGSSNDKGEVVIGEKNWSDYAACRGMPTDMFFFDRGDARRKAREAQAICNTCVVKRRCLALALSMPDDDYGIFGGVSSKERRRIRRMLKENPDFLYSEEGIERYGLHNAY